MSINQGSLTFVISSPQPPHVRESENVKVEKRQSCSTVRHFEAGEKSRDSDEFCVACFPLSSPLCCGLISTDSGFLSTLLERTEDWHFHIDPGPHCLQVHPDRVDDWKSRSSQIWSSIFLLLLTLWCDKINILVKKILIIYTQNWLMALCLLYIRVCPWNGSSRWGVLKQK